MPKSSAALISGDSKILMRLFEGALINEYKKSARKILVDRKAFLLLSKTFTKIFDYFA